MKYIYQHSGQGQECPSYTFFWLFFFKTFCFALVSFVPFRLLVAFLVSFFLVVFGGAFFADVDDEVKLSVRQAVKTPGSDDTVPDTGPDTVFSADTGSKAMV